MHHLTRTLACIAIVAAAVIGAGGPAAHAQSTTQSTQRGIGGPRAAAGVTPPPLPLGDQSRGAQGSRRSGDVPGSNSDLSALARMPEAMRNAGMRLVPYTGPRPPIPKMSDLLKHKVRWKRSASGGTIVLTGTSTVPYLDDQTLSYGASVYWLCQNLTPNTTYRYLVFPPDGTAFTVQPRDYVAGGNVATFKTDATGRCAQLDGANRQTPWYAHLTLSTPLGSSPDTVVTLGAGLQRGAAAGSDSPYSGVWTIAVQNTANNAYEAVAYSVVLGTLNFGTYSNAGFTTKANDFSAGNTIYVSASGLNATHFYAFGFVNTSGNGLPCVGAIPTGAQNWNNATCFTNGAIGILPTNQTLTGQYTTPANGANAVGTQTVQLYDATADDLISTQQVSLNPSTVVWAPLVPYNGALGNGTNLNDTFATDGLLGTPGSSAIEQSVTGVNYSITSGLVNGHSYRITVSNANGVVLSSTTTDTAPRFGSPQFFALQAPFTAAGTSSGVQQVAFPINQTNFTSFGATQTPFGPNVYTAQLYDITAGTVVGSKSFTVVSYASTFQWTNPAGSYVNTLAAGLATPVTATIRNSAGTLYGTWNGDAIKAVTIRSDSGNVVSLNTQAPQAGCAPATQACAFDSLGQQWNITRVSAQQLNIVPAVAGQSLPANGTMAIPFTVAAATGSCATVCLLQTQITPLHGIAPSGYNATMLNTASDGLPVFGSGVVGTNTQATYAFQVGAYQSGAQLGTPRYKQMMYRSGTDSAPQNSAWPATNSYYPITITVTNNSGKTIYYFDFDMPATVDPNVLAPVLASATVAGANQLTNYKIYTQSGTHATVDPSGTMGPNTFEIATTVNAAGLATGKTATFVINQPILLSAFPFQQINGTANRRDWHGFGSTTTFALAPTNALTNAVAGTQNIDSTELGVFSLDPQLMSATISPVVVPALANQNWTFSFLNTSTGLDPNPDYISQLLITVPAAGGANYPTVTSVTASNGATWHATATGTAGQWLLSLCNVSTAPVRTTQASTPCAGTTDTSALPPGGTLTINFNYAAAPAVGTYPINWTVVGANGGGVVDAAGTQVPNLVVANTTAQTSFTFAGGYTATPSHPPVAPIQGVPFGSQPIIGSWSDYNEGNGFVYELHNNGSTVITDVSLAIPWANTSGQLFDTANPWSVDPASIFVYGAGAAGAHCSGAGILSLTQAVNGTPGTSGLLRLSGCNIAVGQNLDIFMNAKDPYDVGSTFKFDASVATGNTTPLDPRTSGNVNTLPIYSLSNTVRVVTDARLAIQIPTGPFPSTYAPGLSGQSNPTAIGCAGCTFSSAGALPLINLNSITGTVTVNDGLAASVYSDSSAGWNLSVSADVNPGTSSGQLSTWIDTTASSVPAAGTYTKTTTVPTLVPTAGSLALSNFNGAVQKRPVDNIMNYRVTVNPLSVNNNTTTTVTLTYTLVAN
jgi:hypothetical protein